VHQLKADGNKLPQPISRPQGDGILHMPAIEHVEAAFFEQMNDADYQKYNRPRLVVARVRRSAAVVVTTVVWYHYHDQEADRVTAEC
jgi:hypothetical protein